MGNEAAELNSVTDELLTLKLRYKQPEGAASQLSEFPIADQDRPFAQASPDFAWAAAVAPSV